MKTPRPESSALQHHRDELTKLYLSVWATLTSVAIFVRLLFPHSNTSCVLFASEARFSDLTGYAVKAGLAHTQGAAAFGNGPPVYNYPALSALVYIALLRGASHPVRVYLAIFITAAVTFVSYCFWRVKSQKYATGPWSPLVLSSLLLAYPFWMLCDRANLEAAVWIALTSALLLILDRRWLVASLVLALAVALKPFPAIFFLLFVAHRRYKELVLGVFAAIVINIAALQRLGPNPISAYRALQPGVKVYLDSYALRYMSVFETRFQHSVLDAMKSLTLLVPSIVPALHVLPGDTAYRLVVAYLIITSIAGPLLLFKLRKAPLANQVIGGIVLLTIFPPVSADYTLTYFSLALVLFLFLADKPGRTPGGVSLQRSTAVALAVCLSPLGFLQSLQPVLHCLAGLLVGFAACVIPLNPRSTLESHVPAF